MTISFGSKIIELILTNDQLLVILAKKTYVFMLDTLNCIDQISTCYNPKGLGAIPCADKPKNKLVVSPWKNAGGLKVHYYLMSRIVETKIEAHQANICALAVNPLGTLIASASERGTIIRIFSAEGNHCLQELRRGTSQATIKELVFHPTLNLLACSSNRTSIHLFEIKESVEKCVKSQEYGFCQNISNDNISTFDNKKSR